MSEDAPMHDNTLAPVEVQGYWGPLPEGVTLDGALADGVALLLIDTPGRKAGKGRTAAYWCQRQGDGRYALTSMKALDHYELVLAPGCRSCTCGDGAFRGKRPGGCRHQAALVQALDHAGAGP